MKLLDLVHPNSIIAELETVDRNGVIRELVQGGRGETTAGRDAPSSAAARPQQPRVTAAIHDRQVALAARINGTVRHGP